MSEKKNRRPFRGRPVLIKLTSLFLPDFETEFLFLGGTKKEYYGLMKETEIDETLLTDVRRQRIRETSHYRRKARDFIVKLRGKVKSLEEYPSVNLAQLDIIQKAIDGDKEAEEKANAMGMWESVAFTWEPFLSRYRKIENVMREASALFDADQYAAAAESIASQPDACIYWRRGSLDYLKNAQSREEASKARAIPFFEFQIALIAEQSMNPAWDEIRGILDMNLASLFDIDDRTGKIKPATQWMKAVQQVTRKTTQQELREFIHEESDRKIETETLKGYQKNRSFPDVESFKIIVESIRGKIRSESQRKNVLFCLENMAFCGIRLYRMTRMVQPSKDKEASEWFKESFEYWREYWSKRHAECPEDRKSSP